METLHIGQVARKTGLSIDAIRFYEKARVAQQPPRSKSGYRLYQAQAVEDLEFIQKAQSLGFSLQEIRQLLSIRTHPEEACTHVRDLVAEKLIVVRTKMKELRTIEAGLADALKMCQRSMRRSTSHTDQCPVLRNIATARSIRKRK